MASRGTLDRLGGFTLEAACGNIFLDWTSKRDGSLVHFMAAWALSEHSGRSFHLGQGNLDPILTSA